MSRALAAVLIALAFLAPPARAGDFWTSRAADDAGAMARRNYDVAMTDGDGLAQLATSRATGNEETRRLLLGAVAAYQNAALARPDAPEPYYREGLILRNFFVSCNLRSGFTWCAPGRTTPARAAQMADAWGAFVRLAPLDPRVDFELMFDLAIASTQAAGTGVPNDKAHVRIEAALGYYQAALTRIGLNDDVQRQELLGNMAETYMMLGKLDEAIALYEQAVRQSGDIGATYGLAVALDRDEQGAKAREIMRALGPDQFEQFKAKVSDGEVFFVPSAEVYYYLALAEDAFGDDEQAAIDWQAFVDSGAHPQFADRARANLAGLAKHKHPRAKAPPPSSSIQVELP